MSPGLPASYRQRLEAARAACIGWTVKWMRVDGGWIKAESRNNIHNPNGPMALEGWVATATTYTLSAYATDCDEVPTGEPTWLRYSTGKDDANWLYLDLKKKLHDIHTGRTP